MIRKIVEKYKNSFLRVEQNAHTFKSYLQAANYCAEGYQNNELIETVIAKTKVLFSAYNSKSQVLDSGTTRTLAGILWIASNNPKGKPLKIIDLGGAAGYHYLISRNFLPKGTKVQWVVVETEAMVSAAKQFENSELKFSTSLNQAKKILGGDITGIFCSGTLQYLPSIESTVNELLALHPKHLFITRTPFSGLEHSIFSYQESFIRDNGPGAQESGSKNKVRYPITFFSENHLKHILQKDFELTGEFDEGLEGIWLDGKQISVKGFAWTKK